MDEVVSELAEAVVDALGGGNVADMIPDPSYKSKNNSWAVQLTVVILLCCIAIPISIIYHIDYAKEPRFTRLTFHETPHGLKAELLVERQVAELHNLNNIVDKISGPTPALKIQEHEADSQSPPYRSVSYRIVESIVRSRDISTEEPHVDSGLKNFIRTIPDERVNAYLNAAATELETHGHKELAQATRTGITEVISTERNVFGTKYAIWTWFFGFTAIILLPFLIRDVTRKI